MITDPRWSFTTTVAVNMLGLETKRNKDGTWVRYADVVRMVKNLEDASGKERSDFPTV